MAAMVNQINKGFDFLTRMTVLCVAANQTFLGPVGVAPAGSGRRKEWSMRR